MCDFFIRLTGVLFLIGLMGWPTILWAHGVVGKRFFPASIVVEDPFPADEMTLAAPSYIKGPEGKETSVGFEIQKRLSPDLGLSVGDEYLSVNPEEEGRPTEKGFANPEFTLTYAMFRSSEHEYIASTAVSFEPGGIGSDKVGAEDLSRIAPAFLFGKGLGDLPDRLAYLRPLAVSGRVGLEVPWGRSGDAADLAGSFRYGLVVEYSIPYLQSFVKDVGLPRPFNRMFPIVELTYDVPMSGPDAHKATGFLNPGIVWTGKYVELGLEAQIPLNDRTGKNTGVAGLIHLFLDDMAPNVFSWTPFSGTLGPTRR
ncbi:MAG: hypothetical protein HY204_02635 [Nitrospirae bacterium]|nr:hypothetical protein [Nitrospirota bacterium]